MENQVAMEQDINWELYSLNIKLIKLSEFLRSDESFNLGCADRALLLKQKKVMQEYGQILDDRLIPLYTY